MKVSRLLSAAMLIAAPVAAHHSFAMFDKSKELWLEGTIKEFQWKNPHTFIQVVVADKSGPKEWSLEGGSPNILERNGWKRNSLAVGEKIKVLIYPLKTGEPGGSFLEIHKTNGSILYYHG